MAPARWPRCRDPWKLPSYGLSALSGFWRRPCPVPRLFPGRRAGRGVKSPKCPPLPREGSRKGDYGQRRSPPGVRHGAQPPRPGDGSVSGVREPGALLSTVPSHVLGESPDRACGQEPPGAACGRRGGPGRGRDTCVCLPFAAPSCGAGARPFPSRCLSFSICRVGICPSGQVGAQCGSHV